VPFSIGNLSRLIDKLTIELCEELAAAEVGVKVSSETQQRPSEL